MVTGSYRMRLLFAFGILGATSLITQSVLIRELLLLVRGNEIYFPFGGRIITSQCEKILY